MHCCGACDSESPILCQYDWVRSFTVIIGWVYFLAWAVSFFPQVILNYQRKSVVGLAFEYMMYNLTGFAFYTTYTIVNYHVEGSNGFRNRSVQINDIAFGVFAVIMTAITIFQICIYERGNQVLNKYHVAVVLLLWILLIYNVLLCAGGVLPWAKSAPSNENNWNLMLYMGYVKSFISTIKCCPQVYLNWRRKSTVGWSIVNILLDITGGTLSFFQNFLDAWNQEDASILTGNIPKLTLSLVTIFFDLVFITQHYILYTDRTDTTVRPNPRLLTSEGGGRMSEAGKEPLINLYASSSTESNA